MNAKEIRESNILPYYIMQSSLPQIVTPSFQCPQDEWHNHAVNHLVWNPKYPLELFHLTHIIPQPSWPASHAFDSTSLPLLKSILPPGSTTFLLKLLELFLNGSPCFQSHISTKYLQNNTFKQLSLYSLSMSPKASTRSSQLPSLGLLWPDISLARLTQQLPLDQMNTSCQASGRSY